MFHAAPSGLDVLLSTVSSDAHTWNLVYLQLALEDHGHRVSNLGACVPDELLAGRCRVDRPDLVVISTVNGHGAQDGARVVRLLRSCPELAGTPIVIGGKLGVDGDSGAAAGELLVAGFDAVFGDDHELDRFLSFVAAIRPARTPGSPRIGDPSAGPVAAGVVSVRTEVSKAGAVGAGAGAGVVGAGTVGVGAGTVGAGAEGTPGDEVAEGAVGGASGSLAVLR